MRSVTQWLSKYSQIVCYMLGTALSICEEQA